MYTKFNYKYLPPVKKNITVKKVVCRRVLLQIVMLMSFLNHKIRKHLVFSLYLSYSCSSPVYTLSHVSQSSKSLSHNTWGSRSWWMRVFSSMISYMRKMSLTWNIIFWIWMSIMMLRRRFRPVSSSGKQPIIMISIVPVAFLRCLGCSWCWRFRPKTILSFNMNNPRTLVCRQAKRFCALKY